MVSNNSNQSILNQYTKYNNHINNNIYNNRYNNNNNNNIDIYIGETKTDNNTHKYIDK